MILQQKIKRAILLCINSLKNIYYYFVAKTKGSSDFRCTNTTLRCELNKESASFRYANLGGEMPVCCSSHLLELLIFTDKILRENEIDYFIFYGTLLGAVRHNGGFVPWDSDVDLCVNIDDLSKIERALALANEKYKTGYILRYRDSHTLKLIFSEINSLHVDFFAYDKIGSDLHFKVSNSSDFICDFSEIYPLKELFLYNRKFYAPNTLKPLKYYGDDWSKIYYRQYTLMKKKHKLSEKMCYSAKIDESLIRYY